MAITCTGKKKHAGNQEHGSNGEDSENWHYPYLVQLLDELFIENIRWFCLVYSILHCLAIDLLNTVQHSICQTIITNQGLTPIPFNIQFVKQ